jgi:hypothetical protein
MSTTDSPTPSTGTLRLARHLGLEPLDPLVMDLERALDGAREQGRNAGRSERTRLRDEVERLRAQIARMRGDAPGDTPVDDDLGDEAWS